MNVLIIRIESIDDFNASIVEGATAGKATPTSYAFTSYGELHATLTPNRLDILRLLMRGKALGIRTIARQLGKDSGNVSRDLKALTGRDIVQKTDEGHYAVAFHRIQFECTVDAAT